jgi:hypothetical protein
VLSFGLYNINAKFKLMSAADTPQTTLEIVFRYGNRSKNGDSSYDSSTFVGVPVRICDTSHRPGSMLLLVDSIILLARGDRKRSRYQGRPFATQTSATHSVIRAEDESRSYWFRCALKVQGNFSLKPTDAVTHFVVNFMNAVKIASDLTTYGDCKGLLH